VSTVTIRRTFKLGGVVTDMTGDVLLTDSGGTYAVKNADTGAVVVTAPVTMMHGGTGVYSYSFTATAANYVYSMKFVYGGETFYATGTIAVPGAGTPASPASLIAEMKIQFGGVPSAVDRITLIENCVRRARDYVWHYCPWDWRHVVLPLVTVPNQAYTALPTNYARVARWGDWLVDSADLLQRPRYVAPERFEQLAAEDNLSAGEYPAYFTIGNETITTVWTPVVRWKPTPTGIKTFDGFHYFKDAPAWSAADTVATFPNSNFDILWAEAASCLIQSRLTPVEQGVRMAFPSRALIELMEDSRCKWESHSLSSIGQDVLRDIDNLDFGGSEMELDADGRMLFPR